MFTRVRPGLPGIPRPMAAVSGAAGPLRVRAIGCRRSRCLRETLDNRRLAILAVCVVEWQAGLADTLVESQDHIVGRTWREAEKICDARFADARTTVRRTLRFVADLGQALLEARHQPAMLAQAVSGKLGWDGPPDLVAVAERLTDTMRIEA